MVLHQCFFSLVLALAFHDTTAERRATMDELFQYLFLEFLGNIFFRIGRNILRVVTLGAARMENPTRFKMLMVTIFGFAVSLSLALLLIWVF